MTASLKKNPSKNEIKSNEQDVNEEMNGIKLKKSLQTK